MGKIGIIAAATVFCFGGLAYADNDRRAKDETDETSRGRVQQEATERSAEAERMDKDDDVKVDVDVDSEKLEDDAAGAVKEAATETSDAWITIKVKTALATDERLDGTDISVDTNRDGVVTLTGTVPSVRAKSRAVSVTRKIEGVRKVESALTVAKDRK